MTTATRAGPKNRIQDRNSGGSQTTTRPKGVAAVNLAVEETPLARTILKKLANAENGLTWEGLGRTSRESRTAMGVLWSYGLILPTNGGGIEGATFVLTEAGQRIAEKFAANTS